MAVRVLLVFVIAYAALLRFDALTLVHGPVASPAWVGAIQETRPAVSALRPGAMTWERWEGRYISDPYTYLQFAREPRGFYDAHRREPGFVFATRASLRVFNDQDVAVSWASACFSVLAVFGTFLLGRIVWSPAVGLLAAAGLAIEMTVITWAVGGWRDDAFTCAVVFTAHALLRLRASPTMANAVWLGTAGAAACLIRITSLSFVVPTLVIAWWLVPVPPRDRMRRLGAAVLAFTVLVAPYLINCWREFGDPLYAINVHADVYRAAEGQEVQVSQTAREYLTGAAQARPMATIETAILGMTAHPFTNKWDGFAVWHPWLQAVLPVAALAGLVGFLGFTAGRVLLTLLAASLVPYALTWRLIGDWRFTAHAYPIFLIAAAVTSVVLVRAATPAAWKAAREHGRPSRRALVIGLGVGAMLLVIIWAVRVALPGAVAREALSKERVATAFAGARDASFFTDGWAAAETRGNVTTRVSTGATATIRLPSVPGQPYDLMIRMDPFPNPGANTAPPIIRLSVDGQPVVRLQLTWNQDRIGAYLVRMPPAAGESIAVQFTVEPEGAQPDRLRVWWVQVRLR